MIIVKTFDKVHAYIFSLRVLKVPLDRCLVVVKRVHCYQERIIIISHFSDHPYTLLLWDKACCRQYKSVYKHVGNKSWRKTCVCVCRAKQREVLCFILLNIINHKFLLLKRAKTLLLLLFSVRYRASWRRVATSHLRMRFPHCIAFWKYLHRLIYSNS